MEPIHHHAIADAWIEEIEAEYRPFSGYGKRNGYYGRVSPFRGYSSIPHHAAVESREDGEANGRIYYDPRPHQIAAKSAEKQRARPVFRMDARHAAIAGPPPVAEAPMHIPSIFVPAVNRVRPTENSHPREGALVGAAS